MSKPECELILFSFPHLDQMLHYKKFFKEQSIGDL